MDSDTILCFKDLNIRQQRFEEQLEDLINLGNESKSRIVLNIEPLDKNELYFKNVHELSEKAAQQQAEEFVLLKEQNECSKHKADINKAIGTMEETLQMLEPKDGKRLGKYELKQIKKHLLIAIEKYSTSFNFEVEAKKHDTETFMASVKFFSKKHVVDFLIDRKNRRILDIKAESVLSENDIQELQIIAPDNNGLNIELALNKLRNFL